MILAAFFTDRANPALRERIFALPRFGADSEAFVRHGTIRRDAKRAALLGMVGLGALTVLAAGPTTTGGLLALAGLGGAALYVGTRPLPMPERVGVPLRSKLPRAIHPSAGTASKARRHEIAA
jgi:uncharacterized membrane protein YbaN (DUF454 family)